MGVDPSLKLTDFESPLQGDNLESGGSRLGRPYTKKWGKYKLPYPKFHRFCYKTVLQISHIKSSVIFGVATKCSQTKCSTTKCSRQNVHDKMFTDKMFTVKMVHGEWLGLGLGLGLRLGLGIRVRASEHFVCEHFVVEHFVVNILS